MDYIAINKEAWDKRTNVHIESEFYDVAGFLDGKSSLNPIELAQLGDVKGKRLLHLQCHFGLDTLSWARLGAQVTGVDLSSESISKAKSLATQAGLDAQFINADVFAFQDHHPETFDVVFTSYGVLCWLPDLQRWAQVIARSLKAGGEFHLVEFHTFNDLLNGESYFPSATPDVCEDGTYTENCQGETSTVVTWPHSISEVVSALLDAGISIESFNEYPYSPYNCFLGLEAVEGEGYQMRYKGHQVPLIYAIKGRKNA